MEYLLPDLRKKEWKRHKHKQKIRTSFTRLSPSVYRKLSFLFGLFNFQPKLKYVYREFQFKTNNQLVGLVITNNLPDIPISPPNCIGKMERQNKSVKFSVWFLFRFRITNSLPLSIFITAIRYINLLPK